MRGKLLLFLNVLISGFCAAQSTDTIRICQYNLLNYGNSVNPVTYKNPRLRTILNYVKPDIFGANEIRNDPSMSRTIRDSVLGQDWAYGSYINTNNEIQTNMLFWKKDRFGLKSQTSICHNLRDIIAYRLYYRDTSATPSTDTVFFTVIVAHLKASNTTPDAADRALETQAVANYLNAAAAGNYIFMGDLNLYGSSEQAYQNLVNNPTLAGRMYDPINRPGAWSGASSFADIHTQSTRTSTFGDGGVTGGLDDRFDHIMVSGAVMNNTYGMKYVASSYRTPGQDGRHLNRSLMDAPTNTSAPTNVIQALYEMSDHLPVQASFAMARGRASHVAVTGVNNPGVQDVFAINPFTENITLVCSGYRNDQPLRVTLYSLMGSMLYTGEISMAAGSGQAVLHPDVSLPAGMYLLKVQDIAGNSKTIRLVKQ